MKYVKEHINEKFIENFSDEQILNELLNSLNESLNESIDLSKITSAVKRLKDKSKTLAVAVDKFNKTTNKKSKIYLAVILSILALTTVSQIDVQKEEIKKISSEIITKKQLIQKEDVLHMAKLSKFKSPPVQPDVSKVKLMKIKNPITIQNAKISKEAKETIKDHEKLRLTAYALGDKMITIGWGHAENIKHTKLEAGVTTITTKQAEELFRQDIQRTEDGVRQIFKEWQAKGLDVKINQGMFDAMVSMAFNMGVSGLRQSDFIQELKKQNYNQAARLIKISPMSKKFPGLQVRRDVEHKMFTNQLP